MNARSERFELQRREQLEMLCRIPERSEDALYLQSKSIENIVNDLDEHGCRSALDFSVALKQRQEKSDPLLQFRCGVGRIEEQHHMLRMLHENADLLTVTIDSYTRQNDYLGCSAALLVERSTEQRVLNGYPLIHHGVAANREMVADLSKPVQVRHGTPDPRLLAEVAFASGYTAFEGGPVTYCIPYSKSVSLKEAFEAWAYVEWLAVDYSQHDCPINRESFAPLSGVLIPPIIVILIQLLEGYWILLSGVTSLTLGITQLGTVDQDVAVQRVLKRGVEEFLRPLFPFAEISYAFHHWMGPFPAAREGAYRIMERGTRAAKMGDASKLIVKTSVERHGVPSLDDTINSLKTTKACLDTLGSCDSSLSPLFTFDEEDALWKELKHLLHLYGIKFSRNCSVSELENKLEYLFDEGLLDIPMAPSSVCRGKVLAARDTHGNVRVLEPGRIPFSAHYLKREKAGLNVPDDLTPYKKLWCSYESLMQWENG